MHHFDAMMELAAIRQDELLRAATRQRLARRAGGRWARRTARTEGAR